MHACLYNQSVMEIQCVIVRLLYCNVLYESIDLRYLSSR